MNTRTKTLIALGLSGYWLRLVLVLVSEGSNDIRTWRNFAVAIRHFGLERTYIAQPLFNHPPLIALWNVLALNLSEMQVLGFGPVFKVPSLLAEVATGILLIAAWKRRKDPQRAFMAFAAYGLSLTHFDQRLPRQHGRPILLLRICVCVSHRSRQTALGWTGSSGVVQYQVDSDSPGIPPRLTTRAVARHLALSGWRSGRLTPLRVGPPHVQ
jgi:hypothetical protein